MVNAKQKGDRLERAVREIEAVILKSFPGYNDKTFRIEEKKILNVKGVHHEIDIWVAVDLGFGYDSIFIFECKNRQKKVGKNDIIIFEKKVKAAQAAKGYFVAHGFTRDAKSQAAEEPRIVLTPVADLPFAENPMPFSFHRICPELKHVDIQLLKARIEGEERQSLGLDMETASYSLDGTVLNLQKYTLDWAENEMHVCVGNYRSEKVADGNHDLSFHASRDFTQNQAVVNGARILEMRIAGKITVGVTRPRIVSYYDVSHRGRVVQAEEDINVNGVPGKMIVSFVSTAIDRSDGGDEVVGRG